MRNWILFLSFVATMGCGIIAPGGPDDDSDSGKNTDLDSQTETEPSTADTVTDDTNSATIDTDTIVVDTDPGDCLGNPPSDPVGKLACCLTIEHNAVMYGANKCYWCDVQEDLFGDAFKYIVHVYCDEPEYRTWGECDDIMFVPTWSFSDVPNLTGYRSFEGLAAHTGCVYDPVDTDTGTGSDTGEDTGSDTGDVPTDTGLETDETNPTDNPTDTGDTGPIDTGTGEDTGSTDIDTGDTNPVDTDTYPDTGDTGIDTGTGEDTGSDTGSADTDTDDDGCPSDKVLICHIPPGNPESAHEICVAPEAAEAHLAHGDYLGECVTDEDTSNDTDVVDTDDDGSFCPDGKEAVCLQHNCWPSLCWTVCVKSCFANFLIEHGAQAGECSDSCLWDLGNGEWPSCHDNDYYCFDGLDDEDNWYDGACGDGKTLICHRPKGQPDAPHELCVSEHAVDAHVSHHGDYLGPCE